MIWGALTLLLTGLIILIFLSAALAPLHAVNRLMLKLSAWPKSPRSTLMPRSRTPRESKVASPFSMRIGPDRSGCFSVPPRSSLAMSFPVPLLMGNNISSN